MKSTAWLWQAPTAAGLGGGSDCAFGWIRELRDRFYREINQAPVMPLHYCYQHDEERRKSKTGNWGHILPKQGDDEEDAYCVENREGWRVFDASQ